MAGFILGIASSLAATALTVVVGWGAFKRKGRWLVATLSRMTGVGILRTYPTQKLANLDLSADLASARWVKVLAGRGNELTRDSFRQVLQKADSRLESVQILLADPDAGPASFLADREIEICHFDAGYQMGLLADQIRSNVNYFSKKVRENKHVQLRVFDFQHICRIILTDKVLYFTIYSATDHGRNSPCTVFSNLSPMYDYALRMFNATWDHGILVVTRPQ